MIVLPNKLRYNYTRVASGIVVLPHEQKREDLNGSQPSLLLLFKPKLLLVRHAKISSRPVSLLMILLTTSSRIKNKNLNNVSVIYYAPQITFKNRNHFAFRITSPPCDSFSLILSSSSGHPNSERFFSQAALLQ